MPNHLYNPTSFKLSVFLFRMNNKEPVLVSIILTLYNKKSYVESAIFSVYEQTYKNWELIILDDCSSDWSFEVAMSFIEKLWISNKVRLIKNTKNLWLNENTKKWFKLSKWKYVCLLDADDVFVRNKLEKCVIFCEENSADFVYSHLSQIDWNGIIKKKIFDIRHWKKYGIKRIIPLWLATASSIFLKDEIAKEIVNIWFPPREIYQDQWICLCTSILWFKIWFIDEPLVLYRSTPWNMSYIENFSNENILKNWELFFANTKIKYISIKEKIQIDKSLEDYVCKGIKLCDEYLKYLKWKHIFPSYKLLYMSFNNEYMCFTCRLPILICRKFIQSFNK